MPPRVLTNADLEKLVDTTDEWILQRTGIRERHIVDPGVATSDIAAPAARAALEEAGLHPDDIGFIVVGTTTPDTIFPSTACKLQAKIGATKAWGFDLGAACSGFTYSLTVGMQMVATGACEHALVVGADVMSSIIDYTDRSTCILFGDGAGAVVLSPASVDEPHIIDFTHEIDGTGGAALCMPAGGSRRPASHETVDERLHYVKQDGQTVFKFAVKKNQEIALRLLEQNGLTAVIEPDFFVELVRLPKKYDFLVISDFAYADICFDGYSAPSFLSTPGAIDVGVEFTTMSKGYSMAGWRIGFCSGNSRDGPGAGDDQGLLRLRHLPADPDRGHRRHAALRRGDRKPRRRVPGAPRRPVRRPRTPRLGH